MTKARERIPGTFYALTRRTQGGLFRLRPDAEVNSAVAYVVAVACARYNVLCVALCVMSNHYHGIFYDVDGRMADFEGFLHGQLGSYFNDIHGLSGFFWDSSEGNSIEVAGAALTYETANAMANPTKAGLVYAPSAWPGLITDMLDLGLGRARTYKRPERYFDAQGAYPEEATLVYHTPPGWKAEVFRAEVEAELEVHLARHRAKVEASGRGWLGAPAVLARSPLSSPNHGLPVNAGRAAKVRPRLMGGTKDETKAMIMRRKDFLERYAIALAALRDGVQAVLFPVGTWRLWRCFGALRGAPGTAGERCEFASRWLDAPDALVPS